MKKVLVLWLVLCACVQVGCKAENMEINGGRNAQTNITVSDYEDKYAKMSLLRIVDGAENGKLTLAGDAWENVYTLDAAEIPVLLDGKVSSLDALDDGMPIDVYYDGGIQETFPAKIGSVKCINAYSRGTKENPGGSLYDISGLYLKVLEDLWNVDSGLNGDIKHISVDLHDAPGLTEGEKSAISWLFANAHNKNSLSLSYDGLIAEGYIKEGEHYWKDGLLFTITDVQNAEELYNGMSVVKFNAGKWRSGLGAYYFTDCRVACPQMGTWTDYEIGGQMIS